MSHNVRGTGDVPEAAAYEEAKEMLQAYRDSKAQIFATYDQLIEDLNQKMEAADKAIRARGISASDWDLYQFQTKVDAEELFNMLGMDRFLQVGGSTSVKTVYGADKAKVEAAAARGDIPANVASEVLIKSPRYHAPKKHT